MSYGRQWLILHVAIVAPAFTTAGIYGILALVVPIVGRDKSPLSPRLYLIIFMLVDFFSGSLQAIGGGLAAAAFSENEDPEPGTYTMLAGIAWQLAGTVVFALLLEFVIIRARHDIWHNPHLVRVVVATMLSITCVVVRGIYRTMELSEGWRGYLITHERFTVALDASMIFVSLSVFNIWNPGFLIPRAKTHAETETSQNQTAGNDRFEVGRK